MISASTITQRTDGRMQNRTLFKKVGWKGIISKIQVKTGTKVGKYSSLTDAGGFFGNKNWGL